MPALPFFSALSPGPMPADTPAQPASGQGSTLNTKGSVNGASQGTSLESDGTSSSFNLLGENQGVTEEGNASFWQQLQMATTLPQGQELAVKTSPLFSQVPAEDEHVELLESEFIGPMYDPLGQSQVTAGSVATAMALTAQSNFTMSDLEQQRQAMPQYQASINQNMAPHDLQAKAAELNRAQVQSAIQNPVQTSMQIAGQPIDPQVLQPMMQAPAKTAQAGDMMAQPQGDSELAEFEGMTLDSELMDAENIHEKPLTLQSKDTLAKPLTATAMDTVQLQDADGADGLTTQFNQIQSSQKANALTQGLDQSKTPEPQEKLNAQFKVDVPPQNPQWNDQIAKRIGIMANEQMQTARIQLDPPELGALEIKIRVQGDQVNVAFASNHAVVRDALENQAPRLRELLEQQGVELADVDVSSQGQQQGDGQQDGEERADALADGDAQWLDEMDEESAQSMSLETDSLVDYFA